MSQPANVGSAALFKAPPVPSGGPSPSSFTLNGERGVVHTDIQSLLNEAKEEVGFFRAGDRSSRSRNPKAAVDVKAINTALAAQHMQLDAMADVLEGGSFRHFLDRLKELAGRAGGGDSDEELERLLDELFPGLSRGDRFAVLVKARATAREEAEVGAPLHAVLERAIDGMSRRHGTAIRSGINADAAARRASGLDLSANLVALYTDMVARALAMSDIYRRLVEAYGRGNFAHSTGFLLGAAGDDLASFGPSVERHALRGVVDALHRLQTLISVERECDRLGTRLRQWLLPRANGETLFESVLRLHENSWPISSNVQEERSRNVLDRPQAAVAFHNLMYVVLESIPAKVFSDDRAREHLLEAAREAREEAIRWEEDESPTAGLDPVESAPALTPGGGS